MKGEIDRDFFCSGDHFLRASGICADCNETIASVEGHKGCLRFHRKHPTPEQYKEEYGGDYPDDGAVYFIDKEWPLIERPWHVDELSFPKSKPCGKDFHIVCACTPWGKPNEKWRPR